MRAYSLKAFLFKMYLNFPGSKYLFFLLKKVYTPSYKFRKYLRFKGMFRLAVDHNVRLKIMNHGNTIENELFWLGVSGWEEYSTRVWKTLSMQSRVIFDVGANTGLYSLISSKANPSSSVYAFEPIDLIFNRLKKNVALNEVKVHLNKIALADEDGEGKIFVANTVSHTFDQASLSETKYRTDDSHFFIIKKQTMASFIQKNKIEDVDLIKIDVETFEPQVLQGMGPYLSKFAPTLLIEILNDEVAEKVEALVAGINYQYYKINERSGYQKCGNLRPEKRGNNFLLLNTVKHKIELDTVVTK